VNIPGVLVPYSMSRGSPTSCAHDPRECAVIAPGTFHGRQAPGLQPGPEKMGQITDSRGVSYKTAPKPRGRVFRTMIITAMANKVQRNGD